MSNKLKNKFKAIGIISYHKNNFMTHIKHIKISLKSTYDNWATKHKIQNHNLVELIAYLILSLIISATIVLVDNILIKNQILNFVQDWASLTAILIGCASIASIILVLYYTNTFSVYNTYYKKTPSPLSNQFHADKQIRKHMRNLIIYISSCIIITAIQLFHYNIGPVTLLCVILFLCWTVLSYKNSGKHVAELSNFFILLQDEYNFLIKFFKTHGGYDKFVKIRFLNNTLKRSLNKYIYLSENIFNSINLNDFDNEQMKKYITNNLLLLTNYSIFKKNIKNDCGWYEQAFLSSKWHTSGSFEHELTMRHGFSGLPKKQYDYFYFDDQIINYSNICISKIVSNKGYKEIIEYLDCIKNIIDYVPIESLEFIYEHITSIITTILDYKSSLSEIDIKKERVIEVWDYLILILNSFILKYCKYFYNLNISTVIKRVLNLIDKQKKNKRINSYINNKNNISFYSRIFNEFYFDGQRFTPDKIITTNIFQQIQRKLNDALNLMERIFEDIIKYGDLCTKTNNIFSANIIYSRYYEAKYKTLNLFEVYKHICGLYPILLDITISSRINNVTKSLFQYDIEVAKNYSNNCIHLWDNKEYDDLVFDYLGDCFYKMLNNANEFIRNNKRKDFIKLIDYLWDLLVKYADYIMADFGTEKIKKIKDIREVLPTYKPFYLLSYICSLSILYGEYMQDRKWLNSILNTYKKHYETNNQLKNYTNYAFFLIKISNPADLINIDYQTTYRWYYDIVKNIKEYKRKTPDKSSIDAINKAVLTHFNIDEDSYNNSEIEELFYILCVNKVIDTGLCYETQYKWDKDINNE